MNGRQRQQKKEPKKRRRGKIRRSINNNNTVIYSLHIYEQYYFSFFSLSQMRALPFNLFVSVSMGVCLSIQRFIWNGRISSGNQWWKYGVVAAAAAAVAVLTAASMSIIYIEWIQHIFIREYEKKKQLRYARDVASWSSVPKKTTYITKFVKERKRAVTAFITGERK